jgi:hypothetical protein
MRGQTVRSLLFRSFPMFNGLGPGALPGGGWLYF